MRCKHCSKTFRTPPLEMRNTQICSECRKITQNNVDAKDIVISRGQARILKTIARSVSDKNLSDFSLRKALQDKTEILHFINENWGNREHFINLALNNTGSNPISLILHFLNLKNKIGKVPTKEKMKEISKFHLSEYEYQFGSWEKFLDLLGFDPWYREQIKPKIIEKTIRKTNVMDNISNNSENYFLEQDSIPKTIEKIHQIRNKIKDRCKIKDAEDQFRDFSYVEMVELLEKYLELLPNEHKYSDINYFV